MGCDKDVFYTLVLDSGTQGVHSKEFVIPNAPFNFPPHTRVVCEAVYFDAVTSTGGGSGFVDSLFIRASAPQPYSMDTRTQNGLTDVIAIAEPTTFLEGVHFIALGSQATQNAQILRPAEYKLRQYKWRTILASPFGKTLKISLTKRDNTQTSENWSQWTCMLRLYPLKEDAPMNGGSHMCM